VVSWLKSVTTLAERLGDASVKGQEEGRSGEEKGMEGFNGGIGCGSLLSTSERAIEVGVGIGMTVLGQKLQELGRGSSFNTTSSLAIMESKEGTENDRCQKDCLRTSMGTRTEGGEGGKKFRLVGNELM